MEARGRRGRPRPRAFGTERLANILARAGVSVPPGTSPYKALGLACGNRTPDLQKIVDAIKANSVLAARADTNGSATFNGIAPETYYLMISTRFNTRVWSGLVPSRPCNPRLELHRSQSA